LTPIFLGTFLIQSRFCLPTTPIRIRFYLLEPIFRSLRGRSNLRSVNSGVFFDTTGDSEVPGLRVFGFSLREFFFLAGSPSKTAASRSRGALDTTCGAGQADGIIFWCWNIPFK
jgi:hypothetical protein